MTNQVTYLFFHGMKQISEHLFTTEEQAIIARSKAEGSYMKAPNGQATNLNKKQWAQVRTRAFREWFGDWENNPDEASKVRDANGEPLVVYHGTPISRDQAADRSKFRIADDWEIQTINAPFHTFRGGAYNGLIFTSLTEEKARSIGETRSMSIPDSEDGREQWTTDSYVYDLFVNARQPFDVKNPNAVKDILDALEGQLTAYDFYLGMEVPVSRKEAEKILEGGNSWRVVETPSMQEIIRSRGYDAIHALDEGVQYMAVFAPNQLKASGKYLYSERNTGVFSPGNNDIRFREVHHGVPASFTGYRSMKTETVRNDNIPAVLAALREKLEDTEQEWQDRILDYIAENYPTQTTVSAQTRSPEGLKEREAMKKDKTLRKMKEEAVAALNTADEKVMEAFKKENGDILFREVKENDGGKSLVGLHNISEEKLLKALKLGGLANPSAAVIDIARQSHEGYGEISLILPSSMIDKRTGRNAGTFSGDAWTPVYPQIERQFSGDGSGRVRDAISRLPQEMQPNVRSAWNSYMDGRDEGSAFAYQFLYERGEAPEFRKIEPLFGEHLRNRISAIDALDDYDERNTALLEVYIEENFGGDQTKFKDYIETRKRVLQDKIQAFPEQKQKGLAYRKAVQKLNDIEERGYEYSSVQDFYDRVKADIRQAGSVDTYHTLQDALDKINGSEALSRQYAEWKESLADKYGIKEVLFKGYTPDGARIYLPHTLENVSGLMKRQGLAAATGWGGSFSEFAAALMKPVGTLDGIRRQKGRLTTDHSDLEAFRDKWQEVYFDLGIKLNPGGGTFDDTGLYRVEDIALKPDPGSFAKREYGVELTGEDVRQLKEMVDAIQNEYPAMYFETKFERPVYLNEFVAAVVPENVSEDVSKAVRESGLQVFVYKPKDESSRNEAVKLASEIKGVRFRLAGGTGAFTPACTASGQVFLSGDERMAELSRHAVFLARKQHIPVNIIHSIGEVDSPKVRALIAGGKDIRGWYDIPSDRICLYLPKARGKEDIERTLLHEGVGHYGLRRLAGRKHMDAFLDDIFAGCGEKVRGEIIRLAGTGKMDIRTATEEYLACMAESGADARVWDKIRLAFRNLLRKLGFSIEVDDRELKGLLAASRENLKRTAATRIPEKIQTPKGELELTPGYAAGSLRSKDGVRDVTPFLKEMKRAGLKPASLGPEEWKSLFSGKGIALPDGRMLMAVKEPAGYGLKITAPALRSIKTAEMEI